MSDDDEIAGTSKQKIEKFNEKLDNDPKYSKVNLF